MVNIELALHRNVDRFARKQFPYCISPVKGRLGDYRINVNGATEFFASEVEVVDYLAGVLGDNGNIIRLFWSPNKVQFEGKYGMVLSRTGVDIWPNSQAMSTREHTVLLRRLKTGVIDKVNERVVSNPETATMLFRFLKQRKKDFDLINLDVNNPEFVKEFFCFLKDNRDYIRTKA